MQKTVPLAQLEEDLAFKRSVWRRSKKLRNRLHLMKSIVYYLIRQSSVQSRPACLIAGELDVSLSNQMAEVGFYPKSCKDPKDIGRDAYEWPWQ